MAIKVGQSTAPVNAAARQTVMHHTGPSSLFKEVSELSMSTSVGPEDESLHYGETWDELDEQRRRHGQGGRAPAPTFRDGVRFGNILTTLDVSTALMTYRSTHDLIVPPLMRQGVDRYEGTMAAISQAGVGANGTHANWLL